MRKIDFKVTFLSDIVLPSTSNTEGNINSLDYITGSSFLGIVAKNYNKFENPFKVFHSGDVRFGEATPLYKNKTTYKVPFCFFSPKLDFDKEKLKNNHFVDYEKQDELDKQYKQVRSGYITKDLDYINLDYSYSQKAAYDKKSRKSKDSFMYGYNAIKSGTTWKFSIKFIEKTDKEIEKQVCENIVGDRFLGKSKTAQYGKVFIEKLENFKEENIENPIQNGTTFIYINSSLALFNEDGMPTFEPTKESLGIKDATINWEKTQIRTKIYTPYNFVRDTKDYSRLVIEKGSIIALENASDEDINILKSGVGGYLSEGYGEVLINPSFVLKDEVFALNKVEQKEQKINIDEQKLDNSLISFLNTKKESKERTYSLGEKVQNFITKYKDKEFSKVTNSQWGQIRVLAQFNKDSYKTDIMDFISNGVSKSKWEDGKSKLNDILEQESIEFIKLLAMQMPKEDKK